MILGNLDSELLEFQLEIFGKVRPPEIPRRDGDFVAFLEDLCRAAPVVVVPAIDRLFDDGVGRLLCGIVAPIVGSSLAVETHGRMVLVLFGKKWATGFWRGAVAVMSGFLRVRSGCTPRQPPQAAAAGHLFIYLAGRRRPDKWFLWPGFWLPIPKVPLGRNKKRLGSKEAERETWENQP